MSHADFTPVTVFDVKRKTEAEVVALTSHNNRTAGDLTHCDLEASEKNILFIGTRESIAVQGNRYMRRRKAKLDKRNVKPFTTLVLGVSPEYLRPKYHRDDPEGFGKYDVERLRKWALAAQKWLIKTFGEDCIYAELHLDERTPHIHAVIVPTVEKKPTMPRNKRKSETDEKFQKRIERAKKKKPSVAVSHHTHPLFGNSKKSYHKALDSYAEAMAPLGIERGGRQNDDEIHATPTTKLEWVNKKLETAKKTEASARAMMAAAEAEKKQAKIMTEAFETGADAVIEEKIQYREETPEKPEGLKSARNFPNDPVEQKHLIDKIKPAFGLVVRFAKKFKKKVEPIRQKADQVIKAGLYVARREKTLDAVQGPVSNKEAEDRIRDFYDLPDAAALDLSKKDRQENNPRQ